MSLVVNIVLYQPQIASIPIGVTPQVGAWLV
jgi:hypothetical protein